ncbi:MAG TPA: PIG-L family deacetylase [Verrucomicrobiae bacterium]|nr:PIG-L family deacetylase [Verrucomicrobiae bacterium]
MKKPRIALAIAAHPDDIEFMMAGTLLLLGSSGFELHYMNLSSGNCGSMTTNPAQTRLIRRRESMESAKLLGAHFHRSLTDDLEIFYELKLLRRLAAVIRDVDPHILLVPSPQDYMEDHTNTCRLAVTAAFSRGMPNFKTIPSRAPVSSDLTLYHAMPHGLRDPLRQLITPELYVNTTSVHATKRKALAAHLSQKAWLDATQGMDSYLRVMDEMSSEIGRMSGRFQHAEGWRRHLHYGFSASNCDPLFGVLGPLCSPHAQTKIVS